MKLEHLEIAAGSVVAASIDLATRPIMLSTIADAHVATLCRLTALSHMKKE